jgi:5-methylcytosine-specific restriction endonuclease McrBC GTP-binding regulatory subunit McrB
MNTADRSLSGLDIALRRRFTFIEMLPQPELLDDVVIRHEGGYSGRQSAARHQPAY